MPNTAPAEDADPDTPSVADSAAESDSEASALLDGAVDVVKARRAALVAVGAARDAEEARMFLAMLGLDALPRDVRA